MRTLSYLVLANHVGRGWEHHDGHPFLWILWFLILAALVTVGVLLIMRLSRRGTPGPQPMMAAPVAPPTPDPAVTELRLRYARGEISRDDYLAAAADLGAPIPPS